MCVYVHLTDIFRKAWPEWCLLNMNLIISASHSSGFSVFPNQWKDCQGHNPGYWVYNFQIRPPSYFWQLTIIIWVSEWVREAPFKLAQKAFGHCPNSFCPPPPLHSGALHLRKKCPKPSGQGSTPPHWATIFTPKTPVCELLHGDELHISECI